MSNKVYGADMYNMALTGDKSMCVRSTASDAQHIPCVAYTIDMGGKSMCQINKEQAPTLTTTHYGTPAVCYGMGKESWSCSENYKRTPNFSKDVCPTLETTGGAWSDICY